MRAASRNDARFLVVGDAHERAIQGNPIAVHARVEGLERKMFARWLELFDETCRELFAESVAREFGRKARRVAESLQLALFYRPDRPWTSVGQ